MRYAAILALLWIGSGCGAAQRADATQTVDPGDSMPGAVAAMAPPGCRADGEDEVLSDLVFEVTAERPRYRQGERVELTLAFSSPSADTYQLDAATYDRSGRLTTERFLVPDEGTVDPLADFFERMGGRFGGGLRTMPMLSREPTRVHRDLNEHVRFDEPGVYPIQVVTSRVNRDTGPVECVSAPFELTILPRDPALDRGEVEAAVAVLRDAAASEEDQIRAATVLRHSLSPEATRAMVEELARVQRPFVDSVLVFGLYGTSHRRAAVDEMERVLDDPSAPVRGRLFDTLLSLGNWLEFPERRGPRPEDEAGAAAWDQVTATRAARHLAREDALAERTLRVSREAEAARATFGTLMEVALRRSSTPAWFAELRAALPTTLADLPPDVQVRLLRDQWLSIADPELVPALVRIVDGPSEDGGNRVQALRRLGDMAPPEARSRIAQALRSPEIDLGYSASEALLALPREAFGGELDLPLVTGLERFDHQVHLRAEVLSRYASGAVRDRVRAFVDEHAGELDSETEGNLYAYLLRVDPRGTVRRLVEREGRAEAFERERLAIVLRVISEERWDPSLDGLAIRLLGSEEHEVVRNVARALRSRGGPAAEAALLDRFRALLEPFRGRAGEFESPVLRSGSPALEARSLSYEILSALTQAEGFVPSAETLHAASEICLLEECRATLAHVREVLEASPLQVHLILHTGGSVDASVASHWSFRSGAVRVGDGRGSVRAFALGGAAPRRSLPPGAPRYRAEALDRMLAVVHRFPRGTAVRITAWPESGPEIEALVAALSADFEANHLRVVATP